MHSSGRHRARGNMIIGVIISLVVLAGLSFLIYNLVRGVPERPTHVTTKVGALEKVTLPSGLPPIRIAGNESQDALSLYQEAFAYYNDPSNQPYFKRADDPPPPEHAERVAELFIRAMHAPDPAAPFLDKLQEHKLGSKPSYGDAMDWVPAGIFVYAKDLWKQGDDMGQVGDQGLKGKAIVMIRSIFVLARREFQLCKRLTNRMEGLMLMMDTGGELWNLSDEHKPLAEEIDPWADPPDSPIKKIRDNWQPKLEVVMDLTPPVGDLLEIAYNDQDPSFRAAAALRMGLVKFNPRTRGNLNAVLAAIERLKTDPDPFVAEAAQAADAFTKEDLRRMN